MAYLAIKGELTYEKGKELISILELLGGNNKYNNDGTKSSYWYYIDSEGIIHALIQSFVANEFIFLTLEEYLYRYPYIVGDKVIYHGCEAVVTSMEWNGDEVCYTVLHKGIKWQTTVFYLQPYKKEPMKEKDEKSANHVFDTEIISFDIARRDKYELDLQGKFNVVLREGKYYVERIKPQYPKTYEECCKVLGIDSDKFLSIRNLFHDDDDEESTGYERDLLGKFDSLWELIICRDAYWKIAGDWKYDVNKTEEYFYIVNKCGRIVKEHYMNFNHILAFPSEEMRDAFNENFKELIEKCKEFL